jgi:hypothetical protein
LLLQPVKEAAAVAVGTEAAVAVDKEAAAVDMEEAAVDMEEAVWVEDTAAAAV